MGGEECIPVQVALQLSDPSTLGLATREPEFCQAHTDLQMALKSIVNGKHLCTISSLTLISTRAPSGLQQLHWNIPQDTGKHTELSVTSKVSEKCP